MEQWIIAEKLHEKPIKILVSGEIVQRKENSKETSSVLSSSASIVVLEIFRFWNTV